MTEGQLFKASFEIPLKRHFKDAIHIVKLPGTEFKKGLSDYIVCLRGQLLMVEAKVWDNDYPEGTPLQRHFLKSFGPSGGSGMVLTMQPDRSFKCKAVERTALVEEICAALSAVFAGNL